MLKVIEFQPHLQLKESLRHDIVRQLTAQRFQQDIHTLLPGESLTLTLTLPDQQTKQLTISMDETGTGWVRIDGSVEKLDRSNSTWELDEERAAGEYYVYLQVIWLMNAFSQQSNQ